MYAQNKAIDPQNMDQTVSPGENFYQYVNGGWLEAHPIPQEKSRYGTFDILAETAREQVKSLIAKTAEADNAQGSVAQKIADFYNSGMNIEARNKNGITPIQHILKKFAKAKNNTEVMQVIAQLHKDGFYTLFSTFGSADAKNSDMVRTHLFQGGLGLPNRNYYTDDDARSQQMREEYVAHITAMLVLAGEKEKRAQENAHRIMTIETRLAEASVTPLEMRDPHKRYNKMDLQKLSEVAPEIDWTAYFKTLELNDPGIIIVGQPDFFAEISQMMSDVATADWRSYLKWNFLNSTASYLSEDFVDQNFDFYGRTMSGTEVNRPLWKRVQDATDGALSEAIGELYVAEYFPAEAKERMLELVGNLKIALGERIKSSVWMSKGTQEKALDKLHSINVKIGYPDKWMDYSDMEISEQAYVENMLAARAFGRTYSLSKINKPVDKAEWHMPPQMVNAYYSPNMNEVVFPAAILQPPFFFMDADDAVNYGAIGVVIGHEMTHGFDDKGRQYNKEGNLEDWWTKEDAEQFDARAKVLVEQFNEFIVIDTMHADGQLSLGENIADLGGLNISLTAFHKTAQSKSTEKIAGFDPLQRFFLAYAHIWAQNIRDKEIVKRTKEDVHSLGEFRVLGPLRNMEEFHKAFGITAGDYMYLTEKERAIIW